MALLLGPSWEPQLSLVTCDCSSELVECLLAYWNAVSYRTMSTTVIDQLHRLMIHVALLTGVKTMKMLEPYSLGLFHQLAF